MTQSVEEPTVAAVVDALGWQILDVTAAKVIADRKDALAEHEFPTFATRAELAALNRLTRNGRIYAQEVWDLLMRFRNWGAGPKNEIGEWLAPARDELYEVWENIRRLIAGEALPLPERPEDLTDNDVYEAWQQVQGEQVRLCVRDILSQIETLDRMDDRLPIRVADDIVAGLPYSVKHDFEHGHRLEWFGNAIALGVALNEQTYMAAALSLEASGGPVINMWAMIAEYAIKEVQAATEASDPVDFEEKLGVLDFSWNVLKGLVGDVVYSGDRGNVGWDLARNPEIWTRVQFALQEGKSVLNETYGKVKPVPRLNGREVSKESEEIAKTTTDDLIKKFEEIYSQAVKDMNAPPL